jgi:calcineurin-like phosphoesterase family protein
MESSRNIFVISDTHFSHQNIIKFCNRPFETAKEMNEVMVERWNSVVRPQDKVYHLGDVYMGGGFSREYTSKLLSSLNGHKRLILGNHDNGKDQILQRHFDKIDVWRMFPEFGLLLTHVPVHESTLNNGMGRELLNIHGHTHTKGSPSKDHQSVCVELINYTPVSIEDLRIR